MAARLTDKQKKKIIADYVQLGSYNATAKANGVSLNTVKKIVQGNADIAEMCNQKKDENTADILAYMDSQKGVVCEIIGKGLAALNDPEKLAEASPAQITTALGTLIDKFTANTEHRQEIHPLLRDMYESRK
nr:MAG TPA: helix-turn-helix domain protein [Caudoviricetes sp.]